MAHLVTTPADNISEAATKTATTAPFSKHICLGTLSGNMSSYVAQVADRLVRTVACEMSSLPTVVAGLLIGAVSSNVSLLVAVAEPQISWWQLRRHAVPCKVSGLPAGVADALIWTVAGHVARFFAVPAERLCTALSCNVPGHQSKHIKIKFQVSTEKINKINGVVLSLNSRPMYCGGITNAMSCTSE